MLRYFIGPVFLCFGFSSYSQLKWRNIDSAYQPLPSSVHIYFTNDRIQDTAPFRAFYLVADLKDRHLNFTTDTTYRRRLTPSQFYEKNEKPLVVVNCTFFHYDQNKNLSLVVKDGKLLAHNSASLKNSGKDTILREIPFRSAIGINRKRNADVAWSFTDSSLSFPKASETPVTPMKSTQITLPASFRKWKVRTAVGGGPVLLRDGEIFITNEEEMMFTGKAIRDRHPRTAMGYTKGNKLIILVIEGRNDLARGATLKEEAQILKDLGCMEALNLDGGGSSCMLVNGEETIKVSDKGGQRPVPAVFIINERN